MFAAVYYGEIDPDFDDGFQNESMGYFLQYRKNKEPAEWGSIAGWAWG